jgi:hypothetical protein
LQDIELQRGKPLFLCQERYASLTAMVCFLPCLGCWLDTNVAPFVLWYEFLLLLLLLLLLLNDRNGLSGHSDEPGRLGENFN